MHSIHRWWKFHNNNPSNVPHILPYKSQNLRPNLDQKVGRATYTRVVARVTTRLPSPLQSIDGVFFVLISAVVSQSLCGKVTAIRLHYHQLTLGLLEICASTERSIGPSLHPVQALKNHLRLTRVNDFRPPRDSLFRGRLIHRSDLYMSIYGNLRN